METDLNTQEGLEAFLDQQLQPPEWPEGMDFEDYRDILEVWVAESYPELSPEDQEQQVKYLAWEQFQEAALRGFSRFTGWGLEEPPESPIEPRRAPGGFEEAPDLDSALEGLRGPVWRSGGDIPDNLPDNLKADVICDYLLQALEQLEEVGTERGDTLYESLATIIDTVYGAQ